MKHPDLLVIKSSVLLSPASRCIDGIRSINATKEYSLPRFDCRYDTVWRIPAGLPFSCIGVLDSRIVILSRSLAFVTVGVIELVV